MRGAEDKNNISACPVRGKILVERVLYRTVWRAVGTQYTCFHKYNLLQIQLNT